MKKLIGIFLVVMSLSSVAQAWTSVQARVSVSSSSVRAAVFNRWGRPIICRGYTYAAFYYGSRNNSYMNNVVINAGTYAYVYVNAYNAYNDPIVDGWANIECRWL